MEKKQLPVRILFVCHGNICRSPMAQYVFDYLAAQEGLSQYFSVDSAACHTDEIGNGPHRGTRQKLAEVGIPCGNHRARLITRADYSRWDFIIGMDKENSWDLDYLFSGDAEGKVHSLLDFTDHPREVADPWYTGNFDDTYDDVLAGCQALLHFIKETRLIEEH